MSQSRVGEKRGRDSEGLKFIPGLKLSQHPANQRKHLFLKKLHDIIRSKSLHPSEFEGYTIRERFEKMGWEQLLNMRCDKIYKRVVIQWVASMSRNGDELSGSVDGKLYTITPAIIRDILGVDTRKDVPYARFNEASNDGYKKRWVEACRTVFGLKENVKKIKVGYNKSKMTPLVQILWGIGVWTFLPRVVDTYNEIFVREIYLLHALFTGDYLYSFAHLMIDDIWDMYEHEGRQSIPHGCYLSVILERLGAVSEGEYVEVIPPDYRLITRSSFVTLVFSESSAEHIIDDRRNVQRVTFPKKVVKTQFTQSHIQPQMHSVPIPDQIQNLSSMQLSQSQKGRNELMEMLTNIKKQMDRQAKQAEIWAHAMIWDMERQRYFYEQEQEQLHKAWNEAYGFDGFQFPQISRVSFHPPQAGSRYYDPTQSDEIPKGFQHLFRDLFGARR